MIAVQSKRFPLAGLLVNASPENLTKPDIHSAKSLALCLTVAIRPFSSCNKPHRAKAAEGRNSGRHESEPESAWRNLWIWSD